MENEPLESDLYLAQHIVQTWIEDNEIEWDMDMEDDNDLTMRIAKALFEQRANVVYRLKQLHQQNALNRPKRLR